MSSSATLDRTIAHLSRLVACDTQNPPRNTAESGVIDYLREQLSDFSLKFEDHGDGCHNLLAVRGTPRILFNFHVDTVPASDGWQTDPFELVVEDGHAVGLGACDIKGAAACMLAAAESTAGDVALLFSTDEEAGSSRCVRKFLEQSHDFDAVIVAEPTRAKAVVAHRGISTCTGTFSGVAGHASERRALADSAVHRAVLWADKALRIAQEHEETSFDGLSGIRFNLGVIDGGIKPNIIAPSATVRFGFRPLPGQDPDRLMAELQSGADASHVEWTPGFFGPTLHSKTPTDGGASEAEMVAESLSIDVLGAVDFWTEASLFSEAGFTSLVYGPGDIAQAHSTGEWVALEQLQDVTNTYRRLLEST